MALDHLLSAMRADADAETARLERESREESARILAAAEREARALERDRAHRAAAELDAEVHQRRALARLAADRVHASGLEQLFEETVESLHRRLPALRDSPGYPRLLGELVHESRDALPAARVVRVDPRDEALVRELAGELTVRPDLRTAGGVELLTDDGRRMRNTLEDRLEAAEPELRMRLGRLLKELT